MVRTNNLIEYQIVPYQKLKLTPSVLLKKLAFIKGLTFSIGHNAVSFIDPKSETQITVSETGVITLTARPRADKTKEVISLMDGLAQKIMVKLNPVAPFLLEFYIVQSDKPHFCKLPILASVKENYTVDFLFNLKTKAQIIKNQDVAIITIKGFNEVETVLQIYSYLLDGNVRHLRDVTLNKNEVSLQKVLTVPC